jgi:hypothetical protein
MENKVMALFVSRKKIRYNSVFKMLGVSDNKLCDNTIDEIGDAIECLVVTGQLCLDDNNNLRRV